MKTIHVQGEDQMVIESVEDVDTIAQAYEDLRKRALPVAEALIELNGIRPAWGIDENDINFEGTGLYANYEVGGMGCYDTESLFIPTEYLFDENWQEDAKKRIEENREKEKKEKELAAKEREESKKKQEYNQYLKLQKKFGGEK